MITDIGSLTSVWATCSTGTGGGSGGGGDGVESVLSWFSAGGDSGSASTEVAGVMASRSLVLGWWLGMFVAFGRLQLPFEKVVSPQGSVGQRGSS